MVLVFSLLFTRAISTLSPNFKPHFLPETSQDEIPSNDNLCLISSIGDIDQFGNFSKLFLASANACSHFPRCGWDWMIFFISHDSQAIIHGIQRYFQCGPHRQLTVVFSFLLFISSETSDTAASSSSSLKFSFSISPAAIFNAFSSVLSIPTTGLMPWSNNSFMCLTK